MSLGSTTLPKMAMCLTKKGHMITMYADEVHPHKTHQYKNPTMDVGAEKLQRPVQRLTLRGGREHRVRVPEPPIYPAEVRSSNDKPQTEK